MRFFKYRTIEKSHIHRSCHCERSDETISCRSNVKLLRCAFHAPELNAMVLKTACPSPPPLSPKERGEIFPSPAMRERGEGGHGLKPMQFMVCGQ